MIGAEGLELIPVGKLAERVPTWPFNYQATMRLIRAGELAAARIKSKAFVTAQALQEFIAARTMAQVGPVAARASTPRTKRKAKKP